MGIILILTLSIMLLVHHEVRRSDAARRARHRSEALCETQERLARMDEHAWDDARWR